jgi:hypothetical protein
MTPAAVTSLIAGTPAVAGTQATGTYSTVTPAPCSLDVSKSVDLIINKPASKISERASHNEMS